MITYKDIADAYIEDEGTRQRYCKYMHCRYHNEEAKEATSKESIDWAKAFNKGIEYESHSLSDKEGLEILREIDGIPTWNKIFDSFGALGFTPSSQFFKYHPNFRKEEKNAPEYTGFDESWWDLPPQEEGEKNEPI